MYTYIGLGLMSVFALMITPGNFDTVNNELVFYGAGTVTQYDSEGNEVFTQTVHNRLMNLGEDFLLVQTFADGAANTADNASIGAICISANPTFAIINDTLAAATFDASDGIADANCKEDLTVGIATGIATVSPAAFTCGGTNCQDNDVIEGFAVCRANAGGGDFTNCATTGILFAGIDSATTALGPSETLTITYNFNVTSPNT